MRSPLFIKNKNGFSLIEILVALGIFAFVSLGIGMSISHLYSMQKQIAVTDVGDNFSAAFFQHLSVPTNCQQIIQGKALPSGSTELEIKAPNFRGLLPNAPLGVEAGTKVDHGLVVRRIYMKRKANVSQGDQVQVGADPVNNLYRRYVMQVFLSLQRVRPGQQPSVMPDRVFEVPVLVRNSAPGSMFSCMLENGAEDACETLGGTYLNGKCEFPSECTVEGTFIKTQCSNPNVTCAPEYQGPDRNNLITGTESCPSTSCPVQSGNFQISRSVQTGKKSWTTITVTENFYICMHCPSSPCP